MGPRTVWGLALVAAVMATSAPASAHAPTMRIAGDQYFWTADFEGGGHAGRIGVPVVGPLDVMFQAGPIGPARTTLEDGIGAIENSDRIPHTFTECNVNCNAANAGAGEDPAFDIAISGGGSAQFVLRPLPDGRPRELEARTYVFFCRIHPFMRGQITVSA